MDMLYIPGAPPPGPIGARLSDVYVVDPNTAVAPADQNGSWDLPFSTVAAALAAGVGAGLSELGLELVPGVYPAEVLAPTIPVLELAALGGGFADLSAFTWAEAFTANGRIVGRNVVFPKLTLTSAAARALFVGATFDAAAVLGGIAATFGGIDATGLFAGSAVQAELTECFTTGTIVGAGIVLIARAVTFGAVVNVLNGAAWDSTFNANLTWTGGAGQNFELYGCSFGAGVTVTGPGGASVLLLDHTTEHFAREHLVTFAAAPIVSTTAVFGTTAQRPVLDAGAVGFPYFDTTIGAPIWWNGTAWVTDLLVVTTANYNQPAPNATVNISVTSTAGLVVNRAFCVNGANYYNADAIVDGTTVTGRRTGVDGEAATAAVVPAGSTVYPGEGAPFRVSFGSTGNWVVPMCVRAALDLIFGRPGAGGGAGGGGGGGGFGGAAAGGGAGGGGGGGGAAATLETFTQKTNPVVCVPGETLTATIGAGGTAGTAGAAGAAAGNGGAGGGGGSGGITTLVGSTTGTLVQCSQGSTNVGALGGTAGTAGAAGTAVAGGAAGGAAAGGATKYGTRATTGAAGPTGGTGGTSAGGAGGIGGTSVTSNSLYSGNNPYTANKIGGTGGTGAGGTFGGGGGGGAGGSGGAGDEFGPIDNTSGGGGTGAGHGGNASGNVNGTAGNSGATGAFGRGGGGGQGGGGGGGALVTGGVGFAGAVGTVGAAGFVGLEGTFV